MEIKPKQAQMSFPRVIAYVFFSMVLFAFGVFIILDYIDDVNITMRWQTADLKYTLLASRIISNSDCLAWEQSIDGNSQVRAGIVVFDKLKEAQINNCISGTKYRIELKDLEGGWSNSISNTDKELKVEDSYFVKIHKKGQSDLHNGVITIALMR